MSRLRLLPNAISTAALALAASACTPEPAGLYVVLIEPEDELECESALEETYLNDYTPDPEEPVESEWTYTESTSRTGSGFYFEVVPLEDGTFALNQGGDLIPGVEIDKNVWLFEWVDETESEEVHEHVDGYRFVHRQTSSTTTEVELVRDSKGVFSGRWRSETLAEERWREPDEWDPLENDLGDSQIPSGDYLYDQDLNPVVNDPEEVDCDGDCILVVSTSCSTSQDFTAVRVADEDSGDYLLPPNTTP